MANTVLWSDEALAIDEGFAAIDVLAALDDMEKRAKKAAYWQTYYDGDQQTSYISDRIRLIRRNRPTDRLNMVELTADSLAERIGVESFGDADWIEELDYRLDLIGLACDAHLLAIVQGTSYGLMWPRQTALGINEPDVLILPPSEMICGYTTSSRWPEWAVRRYVCKEYESIWVMTATGYAELIRPKNSSTYTVVTAEAWDAEFAATGSPPVVEFGERPGRLVSGVQCVIGQQRRIDRLLDADASMVEFASAPSTYVLVSDNKEGIEKYDVNTGTIVDESVGSSTRPKVGPGVMQQLEADDVKQLDAADHSVITERLDQAMRAALTAAKLPLAVLVGAGGNMSGEAITRDSGPLLQKCKAHTRRFTSGWNRLLTYAAFWSGQSEDDIMIVWNDPALTTEQQRYETASAAQAAGVTRNRALLDAGVDEADIQQEE